MREGGREGGREGREGGRGGREDIVYVYTYFGNFVSFGKRLLYSDNSSLVGLKIWNGDWDSVRAPFQSWSALAMMTWTELRVRLKWS